MAKTTRSALGRGLGSLIPDETIVQASAPPKESVPEPKVEPEVIEQVTEPKPVSRETIHLDPEEELNERVVEDNVQIKGVSTRAAKPAETKEVEKPAPKSVEGKKEIDEVDITSISPNPDQPRINFKKDELEELSSSIERDGLLQPILVRPMEDGKYQIIAGERRWQASQLAGLKKVPIRIREVNDDKALELALIENIQRSDLNPIEEAYAYRRMIERNNMTQSEIAQAVSKGRSTIANALRLLELPEDAQQLLYEEKITAGHARAILSIPTKEGRDKLTKKLVEEKISVREAENLARLFSGQTSTSATPRTPMSPAFKKVARSLRKELETGVRIKSSKGKNKIEIEFQDEEDLQRLFERIISKAAEE